MFAHDFRATPWWGGASGLENVIILSDHKSLGFDIGEVTQALFLCKEAALPFIREAALDDGIDAERFFGAKPRDLFTWILERVDLPGWSAQKRARPQPKTYLLQVTT